MFYFTLELLKHYIPDIAWMLVASVVLVIVYEKARAWAEKRQKEKVEKK